MTCAIKDVMKNQMSPEFDDLFLGRWRDVEQRKFVQFYGNNVELLQW